MRNTTIFILLLLVLATAIIGAARRPRTATVAGAFDENIRKVDYRQAYLLPAVGDEILDSCLVIDRKFAFSEDIEGDSAIRRIRFSGLRIEPTVTLRPGRTVALNITVDPMREINGRIIPEETPVTDSLLQEAVDTLRMEMGDVRNARNSDRQPAL